jgi:dTDP-4-amino-4,6-dideoxygalactose transaminase
MKTVYPGWPNYGESEIRAVERVLRSGKVNYWTGPDCREFEDRFAAWAGCRHAICLANGTVALEFALGSLDLVKGDEVIVTPLSFMASASCVVLSGAIPVFADVDSSTGNLSADTIEPLITKRTRAVIVVHLGGIPCDIDPIMELAKRHNIFVIEDCAQAHGAKYRGRSVGSVGDISTWSFCQDKIITTGGEGGMVTTNNTALHNRIWSYKDHGKNILLRETGNGALPFGLAYSSFGTNGRMSGMQAAIGLAQLDQIEDWHRKRLDNSLNLRAGLSGVAGMIDKGWPEWCEPAAYRQTFYFQPEAMASDWDRDRCVHELQKAGIPCTSGAASEIHRAGAFSFLRSQHIPFTPVAENLAAHSIAFCVHPTLEPHHISEIASSVRTVMAGAAMRGTRTLDALTS